VLYERKQIRRSKWGVLVWAAIGYYSPAAIKIFESQLDSRDYLDILKKSSGTLKVWLENFQA
jgi:hypothetical protein